MSKFFLGATPNGTRSSTVLRLSPQSARVLNHAAEIYDPSTGAWSVTGSTKGQPNRLLLLPNGKVLASYDGMDFGAELFDPGTGQFQFAPSTFTYSISANGSLLFSPRDSNGQTPF